MRIDAVLLAATLLLSSCRNGNRPAENLNDTTKSAGYSASHFRIDEFAGYRRLVITNPWQNTSGTELVYYIVNRDAGLPDTVPEASVIRVPVQRIVCMSTTHTAMLRALDAVETIVGISGTDLIYDSLIQEAINRGRISDVGYESNLDKELVVSLKPDLLIAYGVGASSAEYLRKLEEMGVKVMYNADYLEEHPLARCEWIRVFGLLTGKEALADSLFRKVSDAYLSHADMVRANVKEHPEVLLGAPWEGVWYIAPVNSYIGRLISDAGGKYLFDDLREPNSVPFSVEAVFRRATEADIWINPGTAGSLDEIAAADHRMTKLLVYRSGNIWNNRNRTTPSGGNDYWESAVVRPDLLLEDIISIIHPELLPDHKQLYYRRLK